MESKKALLFQASGRIRRNQPTLDHPFFSHSVSLSVFVLALPLILMFLLGKSSSRTTAVESLSVRFLDDLPAIATLAQQEGMGSSAKVNSTVAHCLKNIRTSPLLLHGGASTSTAILSAFKKYTHRIYAKSFVKG